MVVRKNASKWSLIAIVFNIIVFIIIIFLFGYATFRFVISLF